jgi:death-on-curing protein
VSAYPTLDEVLALHAGSVTAFGGEPGVRDLGLLESALAMPQASFGGQDLHETLHEKAAAYLYHIVKNHPFVDGNKRAGFLVTALFLELNGERVQADEDDLYALTLGVANGERSKADVAVFLAGHSVPIAH